MAILLLVALDVSFNGYFWRIPKLTGRAVDYGYQFLLDVHRLSQAKPPGTVRVVAFGSSIDVSFEPDQVQGLLRAAVPGVRWQVGRLLIPGIKPSDYRLFFAVERDALRPDVVVMPLNLVDFLNPSFERDVKPQVRYVLPPWRTLRERYAYVPTASGKLELLLASVSHLYRYRKPIRSAVQDHLKFALQWLRSRPPRHAYGLYADGYARQDFGVPVDGHAVLEYYVEPEWIREEGQVRLTFSTGRRTLAQRTESTPGWKRVDLRAAHAGIVDVAASSAWTPRAGGAGDDARLLGVRLRALPVAGGSDGAKPPLRYPPLGAGQVDDLLRMGDAVGPTFVARWEQVLDADTDFGRRFRAYRAAKLGVCREPFRGGGEYAELERLVADFSRHGTAVVLVNNPESPLLLAQLRDTPYYRGHVRFLRDLAAKYRGVRFYDLEDALPAEDFNDWHHVNYVGALVLGPRYAGFVRAAMADRQAEGHPAS